MMIITTSIIVASALEYPNFQILKAFVINVHRIEQERILYTAQRSVSLRSRGRHDIGLRKGVKAP